MRDEKWMSGGVESSVNAIVAASLHWKTSVVKRFYPSTSFDQCTAGRLFLCSELFSMFL